MLFSEDTRQKTSAGGIFHLFGVRSNLVFGVFLFLLVIITVPLLTRNRRSTKSHTIVSFTRLVLLRRWLCGCSHAPEIHRSRLSRLSSIFLSLRLPHERHWRTLLRRTVLRHCTRQTKNWYGCGLLLLEASLSKAAGVFAFARRAFVKTLTN